MDSLNQESQACNRVSFAILPVAAVTVLVMLPRQQPFVEAICPVEQNTVQES